MTAQLRITAVPSDPIVEGVVRVPSVRVDGDFFVLSEPSSLVRLPVEFPWREVRSGRADELPFVEQWGPLLLDLPPGLWPEFVPAVPASVRAAEQQRERDGAPVLTHGIGAGASLTGLELSVHRWRIEQASNVVRAVASAVECILGDRQTDVPSAWADNGCPTPRPGGRYGTRDEWSFDVRGTGRAPKVVLTTVERTSRARSIAWAVDAIGMGLQAEHPRLVLHRRAAIPAPAPRWLFQACAVQLFNAMADGLPFHKCGNETCGRSFVRQRGRVSPETEAAPTRRNYRTVNVDYCDKRCARAQAQRELRRRQRQQG